MSGTEFRAPRIIYSLWLQGESEAPPIVRLIFRRWASFNPDYELRVLNGNDVARLLAGYGIALQHMPIQALSDVVRARLLLDGGVWADASVFPTEPLDPWLPRLLKEEGSSRSIGPMPIALW